MTFSTWSQTAASNTSVGGISTDGNVTLVNQIDNMFRGMMAELAVARDDGTISAVAERGYLFGLTLSNNAGDATNDIDIAVGEAVTEASPYWRMALASSITKRLDAAWAVGTNQGGRMSAAAIADTTYHVFLIQRSDTGVVDVGFDVSATAPTMPANYDRKRRIGSIRRESGAIAGFLQNGDNFRRTDGGVLNRSSTAAAASALLAISVPAGIVVSPLLKFVTQTNANSNCSVLVASATESVANLQVINSNSIAGENTTDVCLLPPIIFTNTSNQILFGTIINIGTIAVNTLTTIGWVDTRGQI